MTQLPEQYSIPRVVAEIGCNHKGDLRIAKKMISIAASVCSADVVKFQKRTPRECLTSSQYSAPHPTETHSYGRTYGEHRERLEFTLDEHRQLLDWCGEFGVTYSTSVWDMGSARAIVGLKPALIKVASACNHLGGMLSFLCDEYHGELHVSLGMTTLSEEEQLVRDIEDKGRTKDLVLYACTSGYPVPFSDACLLEISRLRDTYGSAVKAIGFSGHHLGIAIDVAAYTLGAKWIERHFTLDRTWRGTDHAASLEPDGLRRLVRDLRASYDALGRKRQEILPIEQVQRERLKEPGGQGAGQDSRKSFNPSATRRVD